MTANDEMINKPEDVENSAAPVTQEKSQKLTSVLKVVIPLIVILVCVAFVGVMLNSAIKNNSYIDGRFILAGNDTQNYIDIDSDGEFELVSGSSVQKGKWTLASGVMTFDMSGGNSYSGEFIDKKYMVMKDKAFLSGEIPDGETIEAEFESSDGVSYGFDTDGKFYIKEDGRNVEAGSYIIDGYFIIVTTEEESITYLKCKDGITPSYYQAS